MYDAAKCQASWMKVRTTAYDQSIVVHAFCPPEAREGGCLMCRYAPKEYRGLSPKDYRRKRAGVNAPMGKHTQESIVAAGIARPDERGQVK